MPSSPTEQPTKMQMHRMRKERDAAIDDAVHLRERVEAVARNLRHVSDGEVTPVGIAAELDAIVASPARPKRKKARA